MKNEKNRNAYVKKMDRQMKDWQSRIKEIEQNVQTRGAAENQVIKAELAELKRTQAASSHRIASVKSSREWPEEAKGASSDYRRMKATAEDLGSRVKKK